MPVVIELKENAMKSKEYCCRTLDGIASALLAAKLLKKEKVLVPL